MWTMNRRNTVTALRRTVPVKCAKCLSFLLLLAGTRAHGQIPVGGWRDHLSWNTAEEVVIAGDKVYCSNGVGLCLYDIPTRSLEKLTKVNGLSDAGISALGYASSIRSVIVGYANGNIDLVSGKSVYNIPDVRRDAVHADKRINHIYVAGEQAYFSCGFGIVSVNLTSRKVTDTYVIGDGGVPEAVNALAVSNGFFYAATAAGVKKADRQNPFLTDFAVWEKEGNIPDANSEWTQAVSSGNHLYLSNANNKIYRCEGNMVENVILPFDMERIYRMKISHDALLIMTSAGIAVCDLSSGMFRNMIGTLNNGKMEAHDAELSSTGAYWIADNRQGLVQWVSANEIHVCRMNGPSSNAVAAFRYKADRLLAVSGGRDGNGLPLNRTGEVHTFYGNQWSSIRREDLYDFTDVDMAADQPGKYYVSSWGGGVYVFEDGALTERYTPENSVLTGGESAVYCGGVLVDGDRRLWVSNARHAALLANGQWKRSGWQAAAGMGRFVEDASHQVWTTLLNNGLWVFDMTSFVREETGRAIAFAPTNYTGSAKVYATNGIAAAPDGIVWVATAQGPVYYGNASSILDGGNTGGYHPNRTGTDEPSHIYALLGSENILSVAVDGAYRKWFGTENGGVFLIDEDNTSEVRRFTADNSPLFSDRIHDIAVNDKTGEVFFATEYGIVSYRSDAVSAGDDFGKVYVFPNPVRPDYHGEITVTGLIRDADVKITDIAGNLVHHTRTIGGQAVWDGCNLKGRRVASGVYLVFCSNDDGSKTHVTKLLFIR
jgi:hypothetical protein